MAMGFFLPSSVQVKGCIIIFLKIKTGKRSIA